MTRTGKERNTLVTMLAGAVAALLIFSLGVAQAQSPIGPANKTAAAGSDIDEVSDAAPILSETMRVSSGEDLILSVSAECSILTALTTSNDSTNAFAFGSVRLWVEIDGHRVPISSDDTAVDNDDEVIDDGDPSDIGEVTFCNRAYERTVTDGEADGTIDTEDDYIRTRTANAFNWLAIDTGFDYDDVELNGQNILTIELWADFDTSTAGDAAADAFVGSRTMIMEPTHVAIRDTVDPQG